MGFLATFIKFVKYIKISFRIKDMLDVNVTENFKRTQTDFDRIIRKLSTEASQLLK